MRGNILVNAQIPDPRPALGRVLIIPADSFPQNYRTIKGFIKYGKEQLAARGFIFYDIKLSKNQGAFVFLGTAQGGLERASA